MRQKGKREREREDKFKNKSTFTDKEDGFERKHKCECVVLLGDAELKCRKR